MKLHKMTFELFVERASEIHNNKYRYWVDQADPPSIFRGYCVEHEIEFPIKWRSHIYQSQTPCCPQCTTDKRNRGSKRLTQEQFVERAKQVHNSAFAYEKAEYRNGETKVCITCPQHGDFMQNAKNHLDGLVGCRECLGLVRDLETFKKKANEIHAGKFDYSNVVYTTTAAIVEIICPIHRGFKQSIGTHLSGRGCARCKADDLGDRQRFSREQFIERAKGVHGDKYGYDKVVYRDSSYPVTIYCPIHGDFEKIANVHIQGQGCQKCSRIMLGDTISASRAPDFFKKAAEVHGNRYKYDQVVYERCDRKVPIECTRHGVFMQTPSAHLKGQGCPSCHTFQSKGELAWLAHLGIDPKYHQKRLRALHRNSNVDAYDPNSNTIYEFYGDYWHGNPRLFDPRAFNPQAKKTFGELYRRTLQRESDLRSAGYRVISIWEIDWDNFQKNSLQKDMDEPLDTA